MVEVGEESMVNLETISTHKSMWIPNHFVALVLEENCHHSSSMESAILTNLERWGSASLHAAHPIHAESVVGIGSGK